MSAGTVIWLIVSLPLESAISADAPLQHPGVQIVNRKHEPGNSPHLRAKQASANRRQRSYSDFGLNSRGLGSASPSSSAEATSSSSTSRPALAAAVWVLPCVLQLPHSGNVTMYALSSSDH